MSLQRAKTIEKVSSGKIAIGGFVVAAPVTSSVVTAALGTALTTAGNGNTSVPAIVSSATGAAIGLEQFTPGVITTGLNLSQLFDANGGKIVDGSSNEV